MVSSCAQSTSVTERLEATVKAIGCYPVFMTDTHYSGNPGLDAMLRETEIALPDLIRALRALSNEAARCILDLFAKAGEVAVSQKSDASPVTEADHAAHRLICRVLQAVTPDIPILSEESTLEQLIGRRDWPVCWMVDPLDGTKEFLEGTGEFTVNIALIVEAESVLGLIAAPNRGYLDVGVPGWGARRYPLLLTRRAQS